MATIKFMYNGIKIDGKLIKGSFNYGDYKNGALVAFYADSYFSPKLREIFEVQNDSDLMTDYFETERIYFYKDSKYLKDAFEAYKKKEEKLIKRGFKDRPEEMLERLKKLEKTTL